MNTPDQFQELYLDVNFDQLLIATNNPLINSSEYYLTYKQNYIEMTQSNLEQYRKVYIQYTQLLATQHRHLAPNKVIFTIIDTNQLDTLGQQLKNILILQRQLLHNFRSYIDYLNQNVNKYVSAQAATNDNDVNSDSRSETASIRSLRRKRGISLFNKLTFT
ncbi:MAG: hypothetical protein EBU90_04245 [Proteobacteria bacterium]|nr:hypothetical protein [Pseudomonadota bacterium]NBP13894.1 hypothetical protein [bacterium]